MASRHRVNAPDVTHESFDTEVLVINLRNGSYYSLRESAVPMWHLLAQGLEVTEIATRIAQATSASPDQVLADVQTLVTDLTKQSLLVERPASEAPQPAEVALPSAYAKPVFDLYTDMQQLLMIDPIHEVDVTGWPVKPPTQS